MKTKGKYTMEANIVSNGQMQNLFRIKSMMKGFNSIDNLEYQLNDMKRKYLEILEMKNPDNTREFIADIKKRIAAINLILEV